MSPPPQPLLWFMGPGVDTDPTRANQNLPLGFSKLESREDSAPLSDRGSPWLLDSGVFWAVLCTTWKWPVCGREWSLPQRRITESCSVQAVISSCSWLSAFVSDYDPIFVQVLLLSTKRVLTNTRIFPFILSLFFMTLVLRWSHTFSLCASAQNPELSLIVLYVQDAISTRISLWT